MTDSPEELAAVEQLLAESDALHGWLTRLDQAPVPAPDTVRDRVRRDYQQRLDQITAGLRAHEDILGSKLRNHRREHAELLAQATAAREALAEADLRHAVGEYTRERYDSERTRHASDIETYDLGLGAVAERIARLEEVHALVQRAPLPAGIEEMPDPVEEDVVPEVHVISEVDREMIAIADLAPDADPDEVLAIFDDQGGSDRQSARGPDTGPLSFRPSGAAADPPRPAAAPPAQGRPFESAPPLGMPSADTPPRFVRPGERMRPAPPTTVPVAAESVADTANEPFGGEIIAAGQAPEPVATSAGRTLRCGECGAMNRPLEWYCEKCGAELTAV